MEHKHMTDENNDSKKRKNIPTRTTGKQWAKLKPHI